jgi:hypothetical protein
MKVFRANGKEFTLSEIGRDPKIECVFRQLTLAGADDRCIIRMIDIYQEDFNEFLKTCTVCRV